MDQGTSSGNSDDKNFHPYSDFMVNDFDDKKTLDEEEALEGSEDPQTELSNYKEEGDMQIDELLAMCGYSNPSADNSSSISSDESQSIYELTTEKKESETCSDVEELKSEPSYLQKLYADLPSSPKKKEDHGGCRIIPCQSDDKNFHHYVDMMVNDIDDERTIDEEEALEVSEDPQTELSNYKEEGDMQIDELLAMCGYSNPSADNSSSISSDESQSIYELTTEKKESETCSDVEELKSEPSYLQKLYADLPSSPKKKEDHGGCRIIPCQSDDKNFHHYVDMMVNDIDDERTIDEEEALEVSEDPQTELSNYKEEGDMQIDELLAMCGYSNPSADNSSSKSSDESQSIYELTTEKNESETCSDVEELKSEPSYLQKLYADLPSSPKKKEDHGGCRIIPCQSDDKNFHHYVDMMVNDIDDERTIDEEEALEVSEDPKTELSNYKEEGDMQIDELLAMCGYSNPSADNSSSISSDESQSIYELTTEKKESETCSDVEELKSEPSYLQKLYADLPSSPKKKEDHGGCRIIPCQSDDKNFHHYVDMMVTDIDDERKIDEEKALEVSEDPKTELSNYKEEGDMQIDELLAMCGYSNPSADNSSSISSDESQSIYELTTEKKESETCSDVEELKSEPSYLQKLYADLPSSPKKKEDHGGCRIIPCQSDDKNFHPYIDKLVHDIDDERTLDEEEALEVSEDPKTELSNYKEEGYMQIDELLAMCGYSNPSADNSSSISSDESQSIYELTTEKNESETCSDVEELKSEPSYLHKLYADLPSSPKKKEDHGGCRIIPCQSDDKNFHHYVDMMVNDIDDERTIDEEEALDVSEDPQTELSNYKEEGDMQIDELLAMCGYSNPSADNSSSISSDESQSIYELTTEKKESETCSDVEELKSEPSYLQKLYADLPSSPKKKEDHGGCRIIPCQSDDKNFHHYVDMMVTDIDDERTIDEEKALEVSEDPKTELSNYKEEGDMQIDELLAMCGYSNPSADNSSSISSDESQSIYELTTEKNESETCSDVEELKSEPSYLHKLYADLPSSPKKKEDHGGCRIIPCQSDDKNFHHYVDMMVNDIDDERTIDEEEALDVSEDPQTELSNYKEEGDMQIDELLAMCGYSNPSADNSSSISSDESQSIYELTTEKKESETCSDVEELKSEPSYLQKLYADLPSSPKKKEDHGGCRIIPCQSDDKNFHHYVDMMVTDIDDERTIDEEKALEVSEDPKTELSNYKEEGDMQIDELLAMCGYSNPSADNSSSISSDESQSIYELTTEKKESETCSDVEELKSEPSYLQKLYADLPSSPKKKEDHGGCRIIPCQSDDKNFHPYIDKLVHDIDDERTLDEEEALEVSEDPKTELSNYKEEGDMQIDELLAMCGYSNPSADNSSSISSDESQSIYELTTEKKESETCSDVEELKSEPSYLQKLYADLPSSPKKKEDHGGCRIIPCQSDDKNFHPYIDKLVHDIDDERTLDEEEALEVSEDPQTELSNYKEEGDMQIDELLAMCGYSNPSADNSSSISSDESQSIYELTTEKKESETCSDVEELKSEPSYLQKLYADLPSSPKKKEDHGGCRIIPCQSDDKNFHPYIDKLVHDIDDERTLDEEEALEVSEDPQTELSNYKEEGEMQIDELLAMCGYSNPSADNSSSISSDESQSIYELTTEKNESETCSDVEELKSEPSYLHKLYADLPSSPKKKEDHGGCRIIPCQSDDKNFHPYIDKLVNDIVDERTLDEEEALEVSEDPQTELSNYKEEGEMPIDELLAMCGYSNPSADNSSSIRSDESQSSYEWTTEKDESETCSDVEELKSEPSSLHKLYADLPSSPTRKEHHGACRLLPFSRHLSYEDDDYDYTPYGENEWKKTIRIGSEYQATIPDGLCKYDDPLPYENKDILLWDPKSLEENELEKFLVKAQEPLENNSQQMSNILSSTTVRDDEQALYLLRQCRYNVEEAQRRRRMNFVNPTDTMNLWSGDECRNFENGLRTYGKDFRMIQKNKVQTRSVGELVQFYYRWKKTERHDIFASKFRPEKKKYTLHPGVSDYTDRFFNEEDSPGCSRDRSSSLNTHSLFSGYPKRQQRVQVSTADALNNMASTRNILETGKLADVEVKDSGNVEAHAFDAGDAIRPCNFSL